MTFPFRSLFSNPFQKQQRADYTSEKNMEPKNGGLEDDVPFQLDDF